MAYSLVQQELDLYHHGKKISALAVFVDWLAEEELTFVFVVELADAAENHELAIAATAASAAIALRPYDAAEGPLEAAPVDSNRYKHL
jgi:hypothetical protein